MSNEPLTVAQLIALLQEHPQDSIIWLEGCDCYGKAIGVEHIATDKEVIIHRQDDRY